MPQPAETSEAASVKGEFALLYISTKSSPKPPGPDVRSSLMMNIPGVVPCVMVPVAWLSMMVPELGLEMFSSNVSFDSGLLVSAQTVMGMVAVCEPAATVGVPEGGTEGGGG